MSKEQPSKQEVIAKLKSLTTEKIVTGENKPKIVSSVEEHNKRTRPMTPDESISKEAMEAQVKEAQEQFNKQIGLHDILEEEIKTILIGFAQKWNKLNPQDKIDFRFNPWTKRGQGGTLYSAGVRLEIKMDGVYHVVINKTTKFKHAREIKSSHIWKTGLYREVLKEMISGGLQMHILSYRANEN